MPDAPQEPPSPALSGPRWTLAACPYCGCDRLASPWGEELNNGFPIICGKCGSLAVFEVKLEQTEATAPGAVLQWKKRWRVRRPTGDEGKQLRADDQVAEWLKAYQRDTLRRATAGRPTRGGPDRVTLVDGVPVGFKMRRRPGPR